MKPRLSLIDEVTPDIRALRKEMLSAKVQAKALLQENTELIAELDYAVQLLADTNTAGKTFMQWYEEIEKAVIL